MALSSKMIWSIVGGIVATIVCGLVAWNFAETANIPKTYATKNESVRRSTFDEYKVNHEKRHDVFENMIKDNFNQMIQMQRDMQHSIDQLNQKVGKNNDR